MPVSARRFRQRVHHFRWLHQIIGVLGGLTFVVGSICFLYEDVWRTVATWLFIIGSAGMFIGNLGNVVVRYQIEKSGQHRSVAREYIEPLG